MQVLKSIETIFFFFFPTLEARHQLQPSLSQKNNNWIRTCLRGVCVCERSTGPWDIIELFGIAGILPRRQRIQILTNPCTHLSPPSSPVPARTTRSNLCIGNSLWAYLHQWLVRMLAERMCACICYVHAETCHCRQSVSSHLPMVANILTRSMSLVELSSHTRKGQNVGKLYFFYLGKLNLRKSAR